MKTNRTPALALSLAAALCVPAWAGGGPSGVPGAGRLGLPLGQTVTLVGRADRPGGKVVHMAEDPGGFLVTGVNGRKLRRPVLISLGNVRTPLPAGSAWVVTGHEEAVARGGATAGPDDAPLQTAGGYRLCFVVRSLRAAAGRPVVK